MPTALQKYLRENGLSALVQSYSIKATRHRKYDNLVLLKYSMIDSPMGEKVVQQCRGIILDESKGWEIVSRPFDKFFNNGEGHAAPVNWSTSKVYEKLDGSLMMLYYYDGAWHVSSSGTPDAGGVVNDTGITFQKLFWDTFNELNYELPSKLHVPEYLQDDIEDLTFMFELMTPLNRVVVRHKSNNLLLIGVRNRKTGKEYDVNEFSYPCVRAIPLDDLDALLASFEFMDPLNQEGYVVVDDNFNRVKVKHPGYVAIHHCRDQISTKYALEIIRQGEIAEFLTYYPEYSTIFNTAKERYEELVSELEADYERIKHIQIRKDFALEALKSRLSATLFNLYTGKSSSVKEFLRDYNIRHLMDILKLKDVDSRLDE